MSITLGWRGSAHSFGVALTVPGRVARTGSESLRMMAKATDNW